MSREHKPQRDGGMSGEAQAFVAMMACIIVFLGTLIVFPEFFMTVWVGFWDLVLATFYWFMSGWRGPVLVWSAGILFAVLPLFGVYLALEKIYYWVTRSSKQSAASEYRVK